MATITAANINLTGWHGTAGANDEPEVEALRQQVNTKCLGGTALTINVMDDDSAASNGTAVFLVFAGVGLGNFYSACAGTASVALLDDSSADWFPVLYNADPATNLGGTQVYFDEDGAQGARFLFVSPFNQDFYVATSSGKLIKIADDDSAATNGVALYVDDDAADATERFLFISPTNVDGTETTETGIAFRTGTA